MDDSKLEAMLDTAIDSGQLGKVLRDTIQKLGIKTYRDYLSKDEHDLLMIKGVGNKRLDRIRDEVVPKILRLLSGYIPSSQHKLYQQVFAGYGINIDAFESVKSQDTNKNKIKRHLKKPLEGRIMMTASSFDLAELTSEDCSLKLYSDILRIGISGLMRFYGPKKSKWIYDAAALPLLRIVSEDIPTQYRELFAKVLLKYEVHI